MNEENYNNIQLVNGHNESVLLHYFLHFSSITERLDVPDPYYNKADGFSEVLNLIEGASGGLLDHLKIQIAGAR
jgi:protein-tyrosine phosphatase